MYQDSCLIYASADPEVLAQIPGCATVAHTIKGGGAMLPLERMARISEQNKKFHANFNYADNLFADEAPSGGVPATELQEYWALLNQSRFSYDAASGSWWRPRKTSEGRRTPGGPTPEGKPAQVIAQPSPGGTSGADLAGPPGSGLILAGAL